MEIEGLEAYLNMECRVHPEDISDHCPLAVHLQQDNMTTTQNDEKASKRTQQNLVCTDPKADD